ncbi:hypothetical protein OG302_36340 [Streptomyces sp. NBC_01283]|uniref:hypothetical protein n=1 Tax=Streptomyces sp. NBC_01283 TaxID=2903812 RepID=UPI00352DB2BF|nr:hypothetical protein OG302_36340 [Streptomyces sp. NBC_01283]
MSAGLKPQRAAASDAVDGDVDTKVALPAGRLRGGRGGRTLVALVLAALLLTGGTLLVLTDRTANTPGAANQALTDGERTRRVIADVSDALAVVFTYTPHDLATTERRARDVLRGQAAKDYRALFGKLRRQVGKQQLSLTTQVVRAGAVELSGDGARLLVFLDQRAKRKGARATTAAAQLSVTARLDDGHWTITDITAR